MPCQCEGLLEMRAGPGLVFLLFCFIAGLMDFNISLTISGSPTYSKSTKKAHIRKFKHFFFAYFPCLFSKKGRRKLGTVPFASNILQEVILPRKFLSETCKYRKYM